MLKEPAVYRNPIMQIRCAQESMIGNCISYLKKHESNEVEYDNFYRGESWVDFVGDSFLQYRIDTAKRIANKLIWC